MARADIKWTFPAAAATTNVSDSQVLGHLDIMTLRIEQMEATTTHLQLQTSQDDMSVSDAAATWDPVLVDIDDTIIEIPVSTSAVKVVKLNPTLFMSLGRVRLVAVDTSDVAVNQDEQVVTATFREL